MGLETEVLPASLSSLEAASAVVRRGGIVAFPTDTVYGLGCDPFNEAAVARLFAVKQREAKPIPVLCLGLAQALRLVEMDETATRLARTHWPGPLTIVAPLKQKTWRTLPALLSQGPSLGVRVPANEFCLALIERVGGYLTGTSANLSGQPSCRTAAEVQKSLGGLVDLILDGGRLESTESTVVRVQGGAVEVLRRGPLALGREAASGTNEPHNQLGEGA